MASKKKRGPDIVDRIVDAVTGNTGDAPVVNTVANAVANTVVTKPVEPPKPVPPPVRPVEPPKPVEPAKARTLADKIIDAMYRKGYTVHVGPDVINIVYVEGMDPDGTPNGNKPNMFNDLRTVIRVTEVGGKQVTDMLGLWDATSEPGRYYTANRINSNGVARIALGQQKGWVVGYHHGKYLALVQHGNLTVYRDDNENFKRDDDKKFTGDNFGINQHGGYDFPHDNIKTASAGCLVGRSMKGHDQFMALVKSDARYKANPHYVFDTTVLEASDIK